MSVCLGKGLSGIPNPGEGQVVVVFCGRIWVLLSLKKIENSEVLWWFRVEGLRRAMLGLE